MCVLIVNEMGGSGADRFKEVSSQWRSHRMRYVYKHDMYYENELTVEFGILIINGMGSSGVDRCKVGSVAVA